ncbi:MAG: substrate-binding domain-containing protein, partial [Acidimicrobiales bacterium]|nr:substrate-binding domain-containing protein [Acidimicrobiales bacterium]
MRKRIGARRAVLASTVVLATAGVWAAPGSGSAGGATATGTVVGEGGDAVGPIMNKLLRDDASGLNPDFGSYTNVDLEHGIADFIGSGKGTFGTDFAVTERKLTSTEAATATANGRTFAYVPIVASPVALVTQVPNSSFSSGATTINSNQFCENIPLNLSQLAGIFGGAGATT